MLIRFNISSILCKSNTDSFCFIFFCYSVNFSQLLFSRLRLSGEFYFGLLECTFLKMNIMFKHHNGKYWKENRFCITLFSSYYWYCKLYLHLAAISKYFYASTEFHYLKQPQRTTSNQTNQTLQAIDHCCWI